jgi:hypothetical protein
VDFVSVPTNGAPVRVPRAGRTLVVVNASTLVQPWLRADFPATFSADIFTETDILIGFDRTPDVNSLDGIAPAHATTTIEVPDHVTDVVFAEPSTGPRGLRGLVHGQMGAGTNLLIAWSACAAPSSIVPLGPRMPDPDPNFTTLNHFMDQAGMTWPMVPSLPVYDAAVGNSKPAWIRPHVPISQVDVVHAVTVANTIFSMLGPNSWLVAPVRGSRLVHRIYVSVSVASLVVIGSNGLTVGAPGVEEVWRGLIPAGQAFPIELGPEGTETTRGTNTANGWRAYTAAAVTFDATVFGG